jgi:hypothetical protein
MSCGNVREQSFIDIWRNSPQLLEVRSIRGKDLATYSSCPHLRGWARVARASPSWKAICAARPLPTAKNPSSELVSAAMLARANTSPSSALIQIQASLR